MVHIKAHPAYFGSSASAGQVQDVSQAPVSVPTMLERILGCKWSLHLLMLIRSGVCRPGAMTRSLPGLTTKVQNACLHRLVKYDILERTAYAEVPPRVEYSLTSFGQRFVIILDAIEALERERVLVRER